MARIFYTERDIEDLAKQGVREIDENDNVYLTDLARERMEALGIKSRRGKPQAAPASAPSVAAPAPAPVSAPAPAPAIAPAGLSAAEKQQVMDKVKAGVIARLGPSVDTAMVDTIVRRVVGQL